jgi:hypothetical protein
MVLTKYCGLLQMSKSSGSEAAAMRQVPGMGIAHRIVAQTRVVKPSNSMMKLPTFPAMHVHSGLEPVS